MAAADLHSPTPEELMAFVDGEGTETSRAAIDKHLATCGDCRASVETQHALSAELAEWRVPATPATLRAPGRSNPSRRTEVWRTSRFVLGSLAAAAAVFLVIDYQTRMRSRAPRANAMTISMGESASDAPRRAGQDRGGVAGHVAGSPPAAPALAATRSAGKAVVGQVTANPAQRRGPSVIRTATLRVVARDFSTARAAVDALIARVGGFADELGVSEDTGSARVLRGALRVPGDRLTETLTALRALGHVTQDQQNAQDVTDQLIDLDARLASARATEERLIDLLRNRTGKLSDVLEVERELTRVRLDIERLDAEKTNTGRRVSYATIELTISEERKAGLEAGPLPLTSRLRVAAADGIEAVLTSLAETLLLLLKIGPALLIWTGIGFAGWALFARVRRKNLPSSVLRPPTSDLRPPTS